jgi:hypothetical protein
MLKLNLLAFSAEDPTQGSIGHGCWRFEQGEIRRVPHSPDLCKCSCVRLFMLSAVDWSVKAYSIEFRQHFCVMALRPLGSNSYYLPIGYCPQKICNLYEKSQGISTRKKYMVDRSVAV